MFNAPNDKIFTEIKESAIKIWNTYSNEFGYVDEKVNRIKDLKNEHENAWYIVAMFDSNNQAKLMKTLNPEAKRFVAQMLMDNVLI